MIADVGGRSTGYDDTGPAGHDSAVVFLHGFPHHRGFWAPQLAELGARYRCIAPDLRGFGQTPPAAPHSMDRYADDVVELLDALGVARAAVVGLSMGGYVAFALWRRHRERVAALVLADTRAGTDTEDARAKRRALMRLARTAGSDAVADSQLPGSIGRATRDEEPERVLALLGLLAAASVAGIVGALEAMLARPDSTDTLETIDVPTLVVVGSDDAITRPAESRAMHARVPGSRLVVVPQAGHLSSFEQPAAFNLALGDFLATVPAVRPTIGPPPLSPAGRRSPFACGPGVMRPGRRRVRALRRLAIPRRQPHGRLTEHAPARPIRRHHHCSGHRPGRGRARVHLAQRRARDGGQDHLDGARRAHPVRRPVRLAPARPRAAAGALSDVDRHASRPPAARRRPSFFTAFQQRGYPLNPAASSSATATAATRTAPALSAAERTSAARIGAVLFRNRGWLPLLFLGVPLLAPGSTSMSRWIVGGLLILVGENIRIAGVAAAGTVTRRRSRNVQRLVTYGAFAWSRNPLYNGNFLIWMGFVVISGVLWFLPIAVLVFAVEYSLIVRYEEGVLESTFGGEYLAYKQRTPRWFPRPARADAGGPHDWREALRSERSTFAQYAALTLAMVAKDRFM